MHHESRSRLHQVLVSPRVGGAGLVAIRLAGAAARAGIRTRAWVPAPGPASDALDRHAVEWRTYGLDRMRGSHARHLFECMRMVTGIAEHRRPIVHVHNPVVYRLLRPVLAATRARTVVHFQIEPSDDEIRWTLAHPPNHVVACARFIAAAIERCLAPARGMAITAVPNAVDLERFVPGSKVEARARAGLQTGRFVILLMANLSPHKGQATAIRATANLIGRGADVECWFAGEDRSAGGGYDRELRRLTAEAGVADRVRFLGFRSDAPDLCRAADAFVLPSTHEGLPLSLLEAQASGTPIVASPLPGILEVVENGTTGFIVDADDASGYADRLEVLRHDPGRRDAVVQSALAQVRRDYGWDVLERRMFDIYASLMGGRAAAG